MLMSLKTIYQKLYMNKIHMRYDDNYLIISDNVYQFTVTIRDATGGEFTYSKFTMAVTLKDDADFIISIVNSDN